MRRVSLLLTALALVLVSIGGALSQRTADAQEASPAASLPTPPEQPATGLGGAEYAFPSVRVTSLGDDAGGGRVFEPTTDAAHGPARLALPVRDNCSYPQEVPGVS